MENNITGMEEIIDLFNKMPQAIEKAIPESLEAAADIIVKEQKEAARELGIEDTGGFINSIKKTGIKKEGSETYIEVYPQGKAKHGNDRKGTRSKVRYATIGFVNEYGTPSKQARPYITISGERSGDEISEKQAEIIKRATGL